MKLPRRTFLHLAGAAAALPVVSRIARAQAYPTRPIRLVVPFPPGGAFDAVGRPWADRMKSLLGTMVVENIGGGGSSLGASAAEIEWPSLLKKAQRHRIVLPVKDALEYLKNQFDAPVHDSVLQALTAVRIS